MMMKAVMQAASIPRGTNLEDACSQMLIGCPPVGKEVRMDQWVISPTYKWGILGF